MTERVVAMKSKLAAVLARELAGEPVMVSGVCRELGISRQTYYKYRARWASEGWAGLLERSRRPASSPNQTTAEVEDEIVRFRKQLAEDGWDNGAVSIRFALVRRGLDPPPSVSTIHRVLVRRGLVEPQPAKKPRSAYKRFEYAKTNACWQMDGFEVELANGQVAVVLHILDDCSRKIVGEYADHSENGQAAWACFTTAAQIHGLPAMMLTDNGAAFSGKSRGHQVTFETNLAVLGVHAVTSSAYHPQTCGKNERSHQTFRRWLAARPQPTDLTELRALLTEFSHLYNTIRPHQALDGQTPNERWDNTDKQRAPTPGDLPPAPVRVTTGTIDVRGTVGVDGTVVQLGREWTAAQVTIIRQGDHTAIFHHDTLVRELTLDRTRRYQPNNRTRTGKQIPRKVT